MSEVNNTTITTLRPSGAAWIVTGPSSPLHYEHWANSCLAPPASVLDCGGGPGRYAIALTQQNYHVALLDLSQGNLNLAEENVAEAGARLARILHGDARHLETIAESSFDAVLLLGPLYHLLAAEDRLQVIHKAHRVLKSGGVLFAAFISRFAPLRDVARRIPVDRRSPRIC